MKRIFKSRIFIASLLFTLLNAMQGFLIMAPILVYLRIHLEKSGSALELWPVPSPRVLSDILINNTQAIAVSLIAAVIIYIAYFPFKSLITGGIYSIILFKKKDNENSINAPRMFLQRSAKIWVGFIKIAILGVLVYGLALFIGIAFGGLLGRFGSFPKYAVLILFIILGSTYLQILKIRIAMSGETSVRSGMRLTRPQISKSFLRLVLGNISVVAFGVLLVTILWTALRWIRDFDWNLLSAILSVIIQQMIVFSICLAQSIRINFNHSIIRKGENDALGRNELD